MHKHLLILIFLNQVINLFITIVMHFSNCLTLTIVQPFFNLPILIIFNVVKQLFIICLTIIIYFIAIKQPEYSIIITIKQCRSFIKLMVKHLIMISTFINAPQRIILTNLNYLI